MTISDYFAFFFILYGVFWIITTRLFHFCNQRIKKQEGSFTLKKLCLPGFYFFFLLNPTYKQCSSPHYPWGLRNLIWLLCFSPNLLVLNWKFWLCLGRIEGAPRLDLDLCGAKWWADNHISIWWADISSLSVTGDPERESRFFSLCVEIHHLLFLYTNI